jgi:hypothetical protein
MVVQLTMQVDDYAEADRREVNPPIEVESANWSPAARSIGGSKGAGSASVGYAVQMVVSGGSKQLIFAALSLDLCECVSPVCPATFTAADRRQLLTALTRPLLHATESILDVIAYPVVWRPEPR